LVVLRVARSEGLSRSSCVLYTVHRVLWYWGRGALPPELSAIPGFVVLLAMAAFLGVEFHTVQLIRDLNRAILEFVQILALKTNKLILKLMGKPFPKNYHLSVLV